MNIRLAAIVTAIIVLSLAACQATESPPLTEKIPRVEVGTSKTEVIAQLGEPDRQETIIKQTEAIFGPPEEWWHTLAMGDRVEIWSYERPQGTLQLYFLRDSETVDYEAFIDKGVVY
jgi:hypothetical protein